MKTTIELPEKLLRQAKAMAAKRGTTLKEIVTDALQRLLTDPSSSSSKPEWLSLCGAFKDSPSETRRIQNMIDQDLSKIDLKDWK